MTLTSTPRSVALVTAVAPGRVDTGKRVVLAGMLDYWCERLGDEAVHYVWVGDPDLDVPSTRWQQHRVDRPRPHEQVASVVWRTLGPRRRTLQESALYSRRTARQLREVMERLDPDVEVLDTVRLEQYFDRTQLRRSDARRVVYLEDLFSVRYRRMLEVLADRPDIDLDPLGDFRAHLPHMVERVLAFRATRRALLEVERRLVHRREIEAARANDLALLVNRDEVSLLNTRAGTDHVHELRPHVPRAPGRRSTPGGPPTFVLLGMLSLPHNHDAVLAFLETCMPRVMGLLPDARVVIVGRGATPAVVRAAQRYPDNVEVAGFVTDLDALLGGAAAVVAPVRFGSGVKIKVIEALAHGVPVLGTQCGVEGVRTGDDVGVLVEAELEAFAARMVDLADPDYNARLSAAARNHYESTYAREAVFHEYDKLFGLTPVGAQGAEISPGNWSTVAENAS